MRDAFVKTILALATTNKNLILITGDLGYNVLTPFGDSFPGQFFNLGIAEQSMTSIACGMALEGKIVFTYSIANFPSLRCLEQIRNDCAYHHANVKIVSIGSGFSYGVAGMSHHGTEDLAILRSIPNISVFSPCDKEETVMITKLAFSTPGTCYIRLGKGGEKSIHQQPIEDACFWKAQTIVSGKKLIVFSTGNITQEALCAVNELKKYGLDIGLVSFPIIKPIDKESIINFSYHADLIVTIEEHNLMGGFGSAIAEIISEMKEPHSRLIRMGINDEFASLCGNQEYLRAYHHLSSSHIIKRILIEVERN